MTTLKIIDKAKLANIWTTRPAAQNHKDAQTSARTCIFIAFKRKTTTSHRSLKSRLDRLSSNLILLHFTTERRSRKLTRAVYFHRIQDLIKTKSASSLRTEALIASQNCALFWAAICRAQGLLVSVKKDRKIIIIQGGFTDACHVHQKMIIFL